MLEFNPNERKNAQQLLQNTYFDDVRDFKRETAAKGTVTIGID